MKHLNASLATEVANWRIWACLLQQQTLRVAKDLNALLQQKLCYKLKDSNVSCNRNKREKGCKWMLMGGNSFVGFCLSKDPKPWSLDPQWGKRETWVSLQVRERTKWECAWDYAMDEWMSNFMQFLLESWLSLLSLPRGLQLVPNPSIFLLQVFFSTQEWKHQTSVTYYLLDKHRDFFSQSLSEW